MLLHDQDVNRISTFNEWGRKKHKRITMVNSLDPEKIQINLLRVLNKIYRPGVSNLENSKTRGLQLPERAEIHNF